MRLHNFLLLPNWFRKALAWLLGPGERPTTEPHAPEMRNGARPEDEKDTIGGIIVVRASVPCFGDSARDPEDQKIMGRSGGKRLTSHAKMGFYIWKGPDDCIMFDEYGWLITSTQTTQR